MCRREAYRNQRRFPYHVKGSLISLLSVIIALCLDNDLLASSNAHGPRPRLRRSRASAFLWELFKFLSNDVFQI